MSNSNIAKKFNKLFSAATVVFFLWHGLALIIAPYPDSIFKDKLNTIYSSYLKILYIDTSWMFFGPNPSKGRLVRYRVSNAIETSEEYKLTESLSRNNPAFFRFVRLFDKVRPERPHYAESFARYLCRRHQNIKPTSIQFTVYKQLSLSPEYYLQGNQPLHLDNLEIETYPKINCPQHE